MRPLSFLITFMAPFRDLGLPFVLPSPAIHSVTIWTPKWNRNKQKTTTKTDEMSPMRRTNARPEGLHHNGAAEPATASSLSADPRKERERKKKAAGNGAGFQRGGGQETGRVLAGKHKGRRRRRRRRSRSRSRRRRRENWMNGTRTKRKRADAKRRHRSFPEYIINRSQLHFNYIKNLLFFFVCFCFRSKCLEGAATGNHTRFRHFTYDVIKLPFPTARRRHDIGHHQWPSSTHTQKITITNWI